MSDTDIPIASLRERLRERLRDLELDACAVKARVEETRELLAMLDDSPRRGRSRKITVINLPQTEPEAVA